MEAIQWSNSWILSVRLKKGLCFDAYKHKSPSPAKSGSVNILKLAHRFAVNMFVPVPFEFIQNPEPKHVGEDGTIKTTRTNSVFPFLQIVPGLPRWPYPPMIRGDLWVRVLESGRIPFSGSAYENSRFGFWRMWTNG